MAISAACPFQIAVDGAALPGLRQFAGMHNYCTATCGRRFGSMRWSFDTYADTTHPYDGFHYSATIAATRWPDWAVHIGGSFSPTRKTLLDAQSPRLWPQ